MNANAAQLRISFQFLEPRFHGRGENGVPEWPPSPLRVFQALHAATDGLSAEEYAPCRHALTWLERQSAPTIFAPKARVASGYCIAVPGNSIDLAGAAWSRGETHLSKTADPVRQRSLKTVRPVELGGTARVTYAWPATPGGPLARVVETLRRLAPRVTRLGWGIDLVVAQVAIDAACEAAETWLPYRTSTNMLRVSVPGALADLERRHQSFLKRLVGDCLTAPLPLTKFTRVGYRRATDLEPAPVAAFRLLQVDHDAFKAFDLADRGLKLAAMARHAAANAAKRSGWAANDISSMILGHGEQPGDTDHRPVVSGRLAYLPLPSLLRGVRLGAVCRLLITPLNATCEREIEWAKMSLPNVELVEEGTRGKLARLSLTGEHDSGVRPYLRRASTWATVTPVVLPGYDRPRRASQAGTHAHAAGRSAERTDRLLRKAIVQAGFNPELAAHAELRWSREAVWPGSAPASRHGVPDHLARFPRLHVAITWRHADGEPLEIPGPICLGRGRFLGQGLFAASPSLPSPTRDGHLEGLIL